MVFVIIAYLNALRSFGLSLYCQYYLWF